MTNVFKLLSSSKLVYKWVDLISCTLSWKKYKYTSITISSLLFKQFGFHKRHDVHIFCVWFRTKIPYYSLFTMLISFKYSFISSWMCYIYIYICMNICFPRFVSYNDFMINLNLLLYFFRNNSITHIYISSIKKILYHFHNLCYKNLGIILIT